VFVCVQPLEVSCQVLLTLVHRYPIDSRTRRAPLPPERPFERGDGDAIQQGREPRPACSRDRRVHTLKVRQQGLPALRLAFRRFQRNPRRPSPSLDNLTLDGISQRAIDDATQLPGAFFGDSFADAIRTRLDLQFSVLTTGRGHAGAMRH
jgi:hypothetical protein